MTDHTFRRPAAWLLAALLAIIAGLGEGLHMIPGLGHGVLVGNRMLLLGETPDEPRHGFGAGACCVGTNCGNSIPLLDEDDCPICQILGASFAPAAAPVLLAVDELAGQLVTGPASVESLTSAVYHARGPPQG